MQSRKETVKPPDKRAILSFVKQSPASGAIIALLLVILLMSVTAGKVFFSSNNMLNVIRQATVLSLVAIGQTFVIISGGIDLSVAPLISLSTIIVASCITSYEMNWGIGALIAILVCTVFGSLNGFLITIARIPPIIATLATSIAFQGVCLLYSGGYGISLPAGNPVSEILGRGKVGVIPISGIIMAAMYVLFYFVLKYTKTGRVTYGLGGNAEAVHLSGLSVTKYRVLVYTICGLMAGVAGIILTGRLNSGHPYNGENMDMDSIAAVVLGGTSVAGGTGSIWGTMAGVFILTLIQNGLNMINMNPYLQMVVKGFIIILAIGLSSLKDNKSK